MNVCFEINDRQVDPGDMEDVLGSAILKGIQNSIERSIGDARCSEHGSCPKVVVKGEDWDRLSIQVTGCCDSFVDQVKQEWGDSDKVHLTNS